MRKLLRPIRTLQKKLRNGLAQINPAPLLILGNQKSGTSAIASLLGEATGLSVTIDLSGEDESMHQDLRSGKITFSDLVQRHRWDFSRDIVKEPALTFHFDDLAKYFPTSKMVFVARDPRDNIRSILDRVNLAGHVSQLSDTTLQALHPGWRPVLTGDGLGLTGRNYLGILATRWNLATDVYVQHQNRLILMRYEDFVHDKVRAISRLAAQLALKVVRDITPKVDIQYQPAGRHSAVSPLDFFGQAHLGLIETMCAERMQLVGYTPLLAQEKHS